eukprot:7555550-Alexandrium_andersonii.AAC.1
MEGSVWPSGRPAQAAQSPPPPNACNMQGPEAHRDLLQGHGVRIAIRRGIRLWGILGADVAHITRGLNDLVLSTE